MPATPSRPRFPARTVRTVLVAAVLALAGCDAGTAPVTPAAPLLDKDRQVFPAAPAHPAGPLSPAVREAVTQVVPTFLTRRFPVEAVQTIGASGDARMAWYLHDLLRFVTEDTVADLYRAFETLTGTPLPRDAFSAMGDRVLAWNLPAPPGYREMKRDLYLLIEPRWAPFFADADSAIDWRLIGWGGVFIDDRPDATRGQPCPRGCIPALDQPAVTDADGGAWYPDEATVFGVVIGGAARAYPKNIMEVHEMVNDTLGGRRIAMPYCTLCLSAQAYFTDELKDFKPLLHTSGLLSRSNKFMYDRSTWSALDTFTGKALSGPLHAAGVTLRQASVVTATWGAWRAARLALLAGEPVTLAGVTVHADADGLRAFIGTTETPSHEAFWFA